MRLLNSLIITLLVAGCASSVPIYTPDGKPGHSLNCSGTARDWGMCYEEASELCGEKGYKVLEKSGEQGFSANFNSTNGYASSTHKRTMIISCNP